MSSNINFSSQPNLSINDMKMMIEAELEVRKIFETLDEPIEIDPKLAAQFPEVEAEVNRIFLEAMSGPIAHNP